MPIHSISHVLQCGDLYRISHDSFFCDYWWLVSLKGLTHIKIVCVYRSEYRVIFVVRINKRKKVINLFLFFLFKTKAFVMVTLSMPCPNAFWWHFKVCICMFFTQVIDIYMNSESYILIYILIFMASLTLSAGFAIFLR